MDLVESCTHRRSPATTLGCASKPSMRIVFIEASNVNQLGEVLDNQTAYLETHPFQPQFLQDPIQVGGGHAK